jgi:hypothetical protein
MQIIQKEIIKQYKTAIAAFNSLDFEGNGHVTIDNMIRANFVYKLPLNSEEFRKFLEKDTVFKR